MWYDLNARDLPWRRTKDPYRIWLSEIMLQQTQVETVLPYYERFLKALPNVQALAAAPEDKVLKLWEGLGYYSRARNLLKAARLIAAEPEAKKAKKAEKAKLPQTVEGLLKLPGIGRYTAGAIASIAFDLPAPAVDGNIKRIYARLLGETSPINSPTAEARLWRAAEDFLPQKRPGDFNQALMDLGATLCRPRKPACAACPLQDQCVAHATGMEAKLPVKKAAKKTPHYQVVAGLIERRQKFLIGRRASGGLLGGLWELPGGKVEAGEQFERALQREAREEVGLEIAVGEKVAKVHHAYSHFSINLHVYRCTVLGGRARAKVHTQVKWIRAEEIKEYAFPAANRKVFEAAGLV